MSGLKLQGPEARRRLPGLSDAARWGCCEQEIHPASAASDPSGRGSKISLHISGPEQSL